MRSLTLRGNLQRSVAEHAAILRAAEARRRRARRALMAEHIRVPQRRLKRRSTDGADAARSAQRPLEFGVNLNNREPLIAPDYDLPMLLDLSETVEERGLRLGLGRRQPLLEAALRADLAALGDLAAHLAASSSARPAWSRRRATRSTSRSSGRRSTCISGGRTILGTGMGNPEEGVRREFEALGLDYVDAGTLFEEGLAVLRQLWTEGTVTTSTASSSTTTTSPSTRAPRWRR